MIKENPNISTTRYFPKYHLISRLWVNIGPFQSKNRSNIKTNMLYWLGVSYQNIDWYLKYCLAMLSRTAHNQVPRNKIDASNICQLLMKEKLNAWYSIPRNTLNKLLNFNNWPTKHNKPTYVRRWAKV